MSVRGVITRTAIHTGRATDSCNFARRYNGADLIEEQTFNYDNFHIHLAVYGPKPKPLPTLFAAVETYLDWAKGAYRGVKRPDGLEFWAEVKLAYEREKESK